MKKEQSEATAIISEQREHIRELKRLQQQKHKEQKEEEEEELDLLGIEIREPVSNMN